MIKVRKIKVLPAGFGLRPLRASISENDSKFSRGGKVLPKSNSRGGKVLPKSNSKMDMPTIYGIITGSKEECRNYFIKAGRFVPGSPPCVFNACKVSQFWDCVENEKDCSAFRNYTGTGKPYLTHIMKDIRPFDKSDNTINDKKINCEKDSVCHTPHKSPLCRECSNFSNLGVYRKKMQARWTVKQGKR